MVAASNGFDTGDARALAAEFSTGCPVEVRNHYLGTWSSGFQVAIRTERGYIVRRNSDSALLPESFLDKDVRRAVPEQGWAEAPGTKG